MKNIFLIGMMGSWKSTVGRKLADHLQMQFVDTDDAIEEITEMKISDIFSEFGVKRFRKMETAFFTEKAKQSGHIFSTGGGIILNLANRQVLKEQGITFLLKASPEKLAYRIHNTTKRPLLNNSENLESTLENIWLERKKYYEDHAHFIIQTDELNPDQVLTEILNKLEATFENH